MNKAKLAGLIVFWVVLLLLVISGLLFPPAGTWHFWQAWVLLAVFFLPTVVVSFVLLSRDPELLQRRMRLGEKERVQRIVMAVIVVPYFGMFLVAGFDRRFEWSHVPVALVLAADLLEVAAYLVTFRVLQVNRYASRLVQVEPGQQVVSTGPYAIVRHPMYAGGLLMILVVPLALGSYWAFLAALPIPPLLAARLLNEEAVLTRDLPGYDEYRHRVRWRLLPGVW